MPRTAHSVCLQTEAASVSLSDATDRFVQATEILMQIARRNGLDVTASLHTLTGLQEFYGSTSAGLETHRLAN